VNSRPSTAAVRYGAAIGAVALAALVTASVPLLHDRLTFFLFWPTLIAISWLAGAGPALTATVLSAIAVVLQMAPTGEFAVSGHDLFITVSLFAIIGAATALVARWRSEAEDALRESRDRFETLANAAPVLIWMADPDGRATYCNRAWLDFTGRALERELGTGWLAAVHPEDRAPREAGYRAVAAAGRPLEVAYRLRRADGEYRTMLDRGVPRTARDGTVVGYIGSCTDITEQREALAAAERARAGAEAANRAKDAFLATVSHELRAPLSPILTWVRMLRDGRLAEPQGGARARRHRAERAHAGTARGRPPRRGAHREGEAPPPGPRSPCRT
jgi:PAS domain S-box-containing protein